MCYIYLLPQKGEDGWGLKRCEFGFECECAKLECGFGSEREFQILGRKIKEIP